MLICPFHFITGYNCPFCGTQRMLLALLHGQWAEAFAYNPFVTCLLLVVLVLGVVSLFSKVVRCRLKLLYSDKCICLGLICLLIWGLVRNFLGI